jgi:glyoxylase-like metal-dependent hydrolase (beta-lactamase superfamily II)
MTPPDDFNPAAGVVEELEPGLRRILAPNPSPMTFRGTNTYILGTRDLAVIDPGPLDQGHLMALMAAVGPGQHISQIIVTHSHLDHSTLAHPLAERTGAAVLAFGDAFAGRSPVMQALTREGLAGGGEGVDAGFKPDHCLRDGERLSGSGWDLTVLHTPGHIGNHICLGWQDRCFTADHVMGWASSLVSPPDGDLTDFMGSCDRLLEGNWRVFYPGHGAPIPDPRARVEWLMAHRRAREASIIQALSGAPRTAASLATEIYTEVPQALLGAATRNVLAHLIDLVGQAKARRLPDRAGEMVFERCEG